MRRAADVAVQEGIGLPKNHCGSPGSVGRRAAAVPGCLQRDRLMQRQGRALKLLQPGTAAVAGGLLPVESEPGLLCWGGGEGDCFFSLAVIFHLQNCGRREGLRWEGVGKFPFGFEENLCKCAWCCLNPGPNYKACGSQ